MINFILSLALFNVSAAFGYVMIFKSNLNINKHQTSAYQNPALLNEKYTAGIVNYEGRRHPIIRLHDGESENFFCTAFVIDHNYALTAAHCISEGQFTPSLRTKEISIYDIKGLRTGVVAKAAGINPRMDWGIIRGDFSAFNKMPINLNFLTVLNIPFKACGYPMGQKQLFCSPVRIIGQEGFALAMQGFLYPGMSGGPVIGDGQSIGINSYAGPGHSGIFPLVGILAAFGIEP